ncbi:MucR family transcriptional regulator [Oceanicola sp. 22II-s10i]|uniref:MucR family transcriptional regulator n=1 Tax=Oceanicola sp. 22II-s10i TaxID=1317116 RepID=UPI000B5243E1|nr:MucR family transcriptional regulator [Oceanicola sp. 22II-s10i]OWU83179.1 MucR family transcriptional regulator [Oceanicola sp. 22II-s10i]
MNNKEDNADTIGRIVAAYASRPDVTPDDIVNLYRRLSGDTAPAPAMAESPLQPALPPARAVTEDKVYCLCCGRGFKMLKRHLGAEHNMTEAEYRTAFGLPEDMPLVAPSYSRKKAEHAKQAGFGKYDRSLVAE